ncbi:carboxylesterase/lipase family protein [Dictyoglomus thermophilum]|uniref:carboxylesterase/lipase family protein n=1 Tax=Dictyoglomus thermophilum TaxID=14 RepID=UPI001654BA4C|nr:carboxylesterase/lipase family protein [Dictyoglomus thermophilum]
MELIVETKTGKVKGTEVAEGIYAWFAIPFAEPPIGNLRFKRAQPIEPWKGIKDCTTLGNDPIQFIGALPNENEDCLNLNIWAPKNAYKLPVMVWFYGGGFHYGFKNDPSYDGTNMAKKGVIRVNINFRLGPLGYYDFNQFGKSFDTNCALSDQIEGLKWVKENIEAFGGDPNNITIFGESGGGCAVYNLLASPASRGLFHKAIVQSGLPRLSGTRKFTKIIIPKFLDYIGIKPEKVAQLKNIDVAKIKEVGSKFYNDIPKLYEGIFMPGPFFGDDLLPERPWIAIKNGSARGIDVILGYNRDEGDTFVYSSEHVQAWFPSWDIVEKMLRNNSKEKYYKELKEAYSHFKTEYEQLSHFVTDYLFAIDLFRCANEQVNYGNVWVYRFDFVPHLYKQMNMGAVHAVEIPFALDTTDRGYFSYALKGTPKEQIDNIKNQINRAWINFVKTGNPNDDFITWPQYQSENGIVHIFDLTPSNQNIGVDERITHIWDEIGFLYDE